LEVRQILTVSRRALPSRNSLRVPVTASVTILKNVTRNGRCALAATHVKSARTQIIFAAMDENLVPSQPERRLRGNSREYLYERLVRGGFHELVAAIDAGTLTVYAAAADAGLVRRPEPLGTGSPNARKRIDWAIHQAYRGSARRANGAADAEAGDEPAPGSSTPGSSTMPIDLAAALAEVEEMHGEPGRAHPPARTRVHPVTRIQRQAHRADAAVAHDRDLAAEREHHLLAERDRLLSIIERLEARLHDHPLAHPSLPCATCSSPCATAAMKEVVDVYVAARRGEQDLAGSVIPRVCCQRQLRVVDPRALIA